MNLKVAFVLQNVGGARFDREVGDTVLVKQSVLGLRDRGHQVTCVKLEGGRVLQMPGTLSLEAAGPAAAGMADGRLFRRLESAGRRLQRELRIPYHALFDSFRFYQACLNLLPNYDLCHEYHGLLSVGAAMACRKAGIPYVLSLPADQMLERELKGTPMRGFQAWLARKELTYAMSAADRIICVSEPAKRHLVSAWGVPPAKIVVLPNGADVDLFSAPRDPDAVRRRLRVNGAPMVMFVGAFQVWHGLDRLTEAFRGVRARLPEARLILVGDGPAREWVEARVHEAGLDGVVRITGYVPPSEVAEWLSVADVAVLPYPPLPQELWFSPLKLYEYMAAGKAIVATRAGQIEEVISDGVTGLLVEPGDVRGLEDALVQLLGDPDRRAELGRAAQAQAVRRHSWRDHVGKLEAIYRDVLQGHPRRQVDHG